ncbi:hypothetical protein ACE198_23275 [Neobacillus sp. KR4-4]|nr:hypothetical protein [Bacillus sp. AFS073361]
MRRIIGGTVFVCGGIAVAIIAAGRTMNVRMISTVGAMMTVV